MNCIQPIAPAELGPMLRPKFDSTLLIAASTCHGIWYSAPACCQIGRDQRAVPALRAALHDAHARVGRLVAALKLQQRHTRALRAAVASLRELHPLDP